MGSRPQFQHKTPSRKGDAADLGVNPGLRGRPVKNLAVFWVRMPAEAAKADV